MDVVLDALLAAVSDVDLAAVLVAFLGAVLAVAWDVILDSMLDI